MSEDKSISSFIYSKINMELYVASGRTVRAWSAKKGIIERIYKNVCLSDITYMCLDSQERKLFIGQHSGRILCIDALTGFKIADYPEHTKEISNLTYCHKYNLLISTSWDK